MYVDHGQKIVDTGQPATDASGVYHVSHNMASIAFRDAKKTSKLRCQQILWRDSGDKFNTGYKEGAPENLKRAYIYICVDSNILSQEGHLILFVPSCTAWMCFFRLNSSKNVFPHESHILFL